MKRNVAQMTFMSWITVFSVLFGLAFTVAKIMNKNTQKYRISEWQRWAEDIVKEEKEK